MQIGCHFTSSSARNGVPKRGAAVSAAASISPQEQNLQPKRSIF